jgi:GT2 family glycosyltransferase
VSGAVTVAIPVRDGGELLGRTLRALSGQTVAHELLVCDSGSRDGSVALARTHGARVLEIAPAVFSHGATRNLLMHEAAGAHVALLTQDAEPADERWLERLLGGFELAGDVALVYGAYRPRPDASFAVRIELERWFRSLAPDGAARVERLGGAERPPASDRVEQLDAAGRPPAIVTEPDSREPARYLPPGAFVGRRGFFTDANACIAKAAWERVPFREVAYAEDRVIALEMLHAGYAKAYVPDAAVWHSHDYGALALVRRSFDEWRGLAEVYGWREPADPRRIARTLRGELGAARRELAAQGAGPARRVATLGAVGRHHVLRLAGALLGSRAARLSPAVRRALSLERRADFQAVRLKLLEEDDPAMEAHT